MELQWEHGSVGNRDGTTELPASLASCMCGSDAFRVIAITEPSDPHTHLVCKGCEQVYCVHGNQVRNIGKAMPDVYPGNN